MKFNEKLILLRKRAGLSQEELAINLGVSRQSVSKWELGECEPNISKIQTISKQFNISIEFLINNNIDANNDVYNKSIADVVEEVHNIETKPAKPTEVKLIINYWFVFIIIGFVGILICAFIPYLFEHLYCFTGHSGFIGYLEDWCAGAIVWKIGLVTSLVLLVLGIFKTFYKPKK